MRVKNQVINLDTHVLLHALLGELRDQEKATMAENQWCISAIVLWEIAKLLQLGRISFGFSDSNLGVVLSRIRTLPIDLEISVASTKLDFRSDPADELIAATSIVYEIPLLTRDAKIRASKLVPLC